MTRVGRFVAFVLAATLLGAAIVVVRPGLAEAAPVHDVFPYAIGDTASGSLETPDSSDTYTFAGVAGQSVFFDVVTNDVGGWWTLRSPSDVVVFDYFLTDVGPMVLPETGAYELVVYGAGEATGGFSFRTNLTIDEAFAYAIGDAASESLEVPGSSDTYTFAGVAGQSVFFDVVTNDVGGWWTLRSPSDVVVFDYFLTDVGPMVLPETGAYELVVYGAGEATGGFSFRTNLTIDEAFAYAIGDAASESLEVPGSSDTYTFAGVAGQSVFFDVVTNDVGGWWTLRSPSDVVVFDYFLTDVGPMILPETGAYELVVYGAGEATGAFSFRTNLTVDDSFAYVLGNTASGSLECRGRVTPTRSRVRPGSRCSSTC